jgi:hypothetical protein
MKKNPSSPVGTGPRGSGMVQGRYPQDGLAGRNINRRQLDVRVVDNPPDAQSFISGEEQLRPGLWRILPVFRPPADPTNWPGPVLYVAWFRLHNPCAHSQADPLALTPAQPPDEPISWVVGYREVFIDEDCKLYYTIPAGCCLTFVLLSELDEP